ncbi:MAG: MarR family transcriptional regulator [Beijerinckiaceae bacterium]|nr:MarR family transcriptional regulator [Beijerinckiaceae bacterium]MCI0734913.1 MarR family transcriptional regulator [Beijerinckiaceae bacterium]
MPDAAAKSRLEQQVCFAIYSAMHAVNKAYMPLLEKIALTYPQYIAMLVLWESDDVTVKELGERLFLDSGTLTPLLKRLEAMGLVHRARDPKDERKVRLSLTERGKNLRRDAQCIPGQIAAAMGRPADDLKAVRKELRRIRNSLLEGRALKVPEVESGAASG